jgi:hypothetical protein
MNPSAKSKLTALQNEERYVFHGSGLRLEQLEPRQAYTVIDGMSVADGLPAIFATQFADYAIFMALINPQTCPLGARSRCGYEEGRLVFAASRHTLDQLNGSTIGFVHVFDRVDFELRGGPEWMCLKRIKPSSVVEVSLADFCEVISEIPHGL